MAESVLVRHAKSFTSSPAIPEAIGNGIPLRQHEKRTSRLASPTNRWMVCVALVALLGALIALVAYGNGRVCRSIDIAQSIALAGCPKSGSP